MDDLLAAADTEHSPDDIQPGRHQHPDTKNQNDSTVSSRHQHTQPGCASHRQGVVTRSTTPLKVNRNLGVRQEHGAATCQQADAATSSRRAASLGSSNGVLLKPNSGVWVFSVLPVCICSLASIV